MSMSTSVPASSLKAEDASAVNAPTPPTAPTRAKDAPEQPLPTHLAVLTIGVISGLMIERLRQERENRRADKLGSILLLLLLAGAILFFCTRCAPAPVTSEPATASTSAARPSPAAANLPDLPIPCPGWPKRVALLFDQSLSTATTRTEHPSITALTPLVECATATGGELLVGTIRDEADVTLARVLLEAPPTPPRPPSLTDNPIIDYDQAAAFANEATAYRLTYDRWRKRASASAEQFHAQAAALLNQPTDAPVTPLAATVGRAYLALDEPTPFAWLARAERVLVIVSDGEDTVSSVTVPAPTRPMTIVIVNGEGRRADLAHLRPVPFESFTSAVRALAGGRHVH